MESEIKEQLIKSVKSIKNKLKQMHREEDDLERKRQKILKPITEPLNTIISLNKSNKIDSTKRFSPVKENNTEFEKYDSCESETDSSNDDEKLEKTSQKMEIPTKLESHIENANMSGLETNEDKLLNVTYGVRRDDKGELVIGNTPITFKTIGKSTKLTFNDKIYDLTPGLKELLFENKPDECMIAEKDKLVYKDILVHTNAHKRGFVSSGQILGNSGKKYSSIIKPLFNEPGKTLKQGGSLKILKKYRPNTDFVYWDDPNELIERLKILVASKNAGNTNHDNEIISIIEELKEAGIIKG